MLSRKLNTRALSKPDTKGHKCEYFKLMLEYYNRTDNTFMMARCWHELYLTAANPATLTTENEAAVQGKFKDAYDELKKFDALSNCVVLALLSAHASQKDIEDAAECAAFSKESNQTDRQKWLLELAENRDVKNELPRLQKLLEAFNSVEMIRTSQTSEIASIAEWHPVLKSHHARL